MLHTGYDATLSDQSLSGGRSAEIAGESESEAEMDGERASPARGVGSNFWLGARN